MGAVLQRVVCKYCQRVVCKYCGEWFDRKMGKRGRPRLYCTKTCRDKEMARLACLRHAKPPG